MGRLGVVLSVETNGENGEHIDDVKVDFGGGDVARISLFAAAGDDAPPIAGDYCAEIEGACVAVGDPGNPGVAAGGERRIYSRDTSGATIAEVYLKSDGAIEIKNQVGLIEMSAAGVVTINGNLEVLP